MGQDEPPIQEAWASLQKFGAKYLSIYFMVANSRCLVCTFIPNQANTPGVDGGIYMILFILCDVVTILSKDAAWFPWKARRFAPSVRVV